MRLDGWKFDVSRRGLLGGLATSLLLLARRSLLAAETGGVEPVVRVGSVQGGTLSWLLDEIAALGLDRAAGVRIEAVPTPGFADAAAFTHAFGMSAFV